jgi:type IV pilus assembly protein PilN
MILINLLPHRELARKKRKEMFAVSAGATALGGGLVAFLVSLWFQHAIGLQTSRNAFLDQETLKLDAQIKDIASLRTEIQALKARQTAVENLQSDRNTPVHLLNELVSQIPEGIYLTQVKQEAQSVSVVGVAQSQERVSELLRNFSSGSPWLAKPDLVEIISAQQQLSPRDQRRVFNFTIKAQLVRADTKKGAGTAPDALTAGQN